jgi:branched-chain amino acid transport system substrate-binding protein
MLRPFLVFAFACFATQSIAQERPVLVGVTVAKTGQLSDHGANYGRGLALWLEDVNARGGMLGRKVELRVRDDLSQAIGVGVLYEKLLDEDRADLLLGPMGSAATLPAMAVAEQRRRILVNATGVDPAVLRRGNRYAFQVPAGTADYGAHVWTVVRRAGAKLTLIVDKDETGAAARLREDAEKLGIPYVKAELTTAVGYAALVDYARQNGVDAVIVAGPAREAAEAVKAMKRGEWTPLVFVATSAMHPEFTRMVGQDAEFAIGISPYATAQRTPGNAGFVRAYRAMHKQLPDFYAACGYAAGRVLEAAVREAGALDQEKLREALMRVRVETPLGTYEAGKDGAQAGVRPPLLQLQNGRRQVVWPEAVATAKLVLPYPAWSSRTLMK